MCNAASSLIGLQVVCECTVRIVTIIANLRSFAINVTNYNASCISLMSLHGDNFFRPLWESVGMRRGFDPHFHHLNAYRRSFPLQVWPKSTILFRSCWVPFLTSSSASPLIFIPLSPFHLYLSLIAPIHSLIRSFINSFVRSFFRSFVCSFIHSFIHSFSSSFILVSIHHHILLTFLVLFTIWPFIDIDKLTPQVTRSGLVVGKSVAPQPTSLNAALRHNYAQARRPLYDYDYALYNDYLLVAGWWADLKITINVSK